MSVYDDKDLMGYIDKIIQLIADGDYYSARTDQIILNCVKSFGAEWLEVIRMMIDLAKNNSNNTVTSIECDLDYFDNVCNDDKEEEDKDICPMFCDLVDTTKTNSKV